MTAAPIRLRRGDVVRTWFDTGALGATLLYGRVIAAGPRQFAVRWESGIVNRCQQGRRDVERLTASACDYAAAVDALDRRDQLEATVTR